MTRAAVYIVGLSTLVAATVLTCISVTTPNWLSWTSTSPTGTPLYTTIGLHRSCSSETSQCRHFPRNSDCHGSDRYFCSLWRSAGFLVTFVVALDLVTIVAFAIVILGGQKKRIHGWKILTVLLALVACAQCMAMAIVAYLFDHDERFFIGWKLDAGFVLSTVSWILAASTAGFISLAAVFLPNEGDYELLPTDEVVE